MDRRRRLAASLGAVVGVGLTALASGCARPSPEGVRVVLVTLDTLRYDSFAGAGGEPPPMLRLAGRAGQALVFERFYASSSTTQPTHASFLTGLHPWQHGVTRNGLVLADRHTTVTEILQQAGFRTAAVVASVPVSRRFGFAQGFDRYEDEFAKTFGHEVWEGIHVPDRRFYSLAETVTARASELLGSLGGQRQFLWVHYFDPHAPYGDSAGGPGLETEVILTKAVRQGGGVEAEVREARRLYAEDVAYLDRELDRLLERLREDEAAFETHVVIVSDHGESLGEDGSLGHGKRLTREQLHVPCLILSPRVVPRARREVAAAIDVAPTLLSLAGVPSKLAGGRDLLPPPRGPTRALGMRRSFVTPYRDPRLDGTVHVIDRNAFFLVDEAERLYRGDAHAVEADAGGPGQPLDGELAAELMARFAAFENELRGSEVAEPLDAETQRALEALGYVQ
jgi:arylsulfatase A-like enzyme